MYSSSKNFKIRGGQMKSKIFIILTVFFLLSGLSYAQEIIYTEISGPDSLIRGDSADYTCTAYYDDDTFMDVTDISAWVSLCEYADINFLFF